MSLLSRVLVLYFWLQWMNEGSVFVTSNGREWSGNVVSGTVFVNGTAPIGTTDDNFICATIDWWPPEKCDYGTCSWEKASLLNLDLSNPKLLNAIKAFSPLKIRMGGTLQDNVIYETRGGKHPCVPFTKNTSDMFGFSKGCLPMSRWDELNIFFKKSGAMVVFGLNALSGRTIGPDGSAMGAWDSSNAESLIRYTVNKGYTIYGWELGNELCGSGIGARVAADQYASDVNTLQNIVQNTYRGFEFKPLVIAPGGFFDANWFKEYVKQAPKTLQVVTQHIYNLGPGNDNKLMNKILDPSYLDGGEQPFRDLQTILKNSSTPAVAWVGEAGGAYNSGQNLVSNSFVYSFWYLDQLGMASSYDTKTYCRQTLVGGNYGLLDTATFVPHPDYYSALLWHRLMGSKVLSTSFSGTKSIRAYAHCSKQSQGITLLLINLNATTTVRVRVSTETSASNGGLILQQQQEEERAPRINFSTMSRNSKRNGNNSREEYHLTSKDGNLHSKIVVLNGKILTLTSTGGIPPMEPVNRSMFEPITVAPFSIVFSHIPTIKLPACN